VLGYALRNSALIGAEGLTTAGASAPHNVHVIAPRLGWATIIAGWLAMLATPVIGVLAGHPIAAARSVPQVAAYLLTGTVVFAKQPRNPVTRRLLAYGVLLAAGYVIGSAYSAYLAGAGTAGWAWLVILAMQGIDLASFIVIFAACAVFPDGKYQRAYERRVVAVLAAAVPALLAAQLVGSARLTQTDFVWQNSVSAANPAALPALAGLGAVSAVLIQAGDAALLLGVVVLILRYRRFGPAERQQVAWPLYALALTGCAILVLGATSSADHKLPDWLQYLFYVPVLLLIPAGLVIGIVRYRLLDIDLVVRRSVVYGALWLLIAVGYAGLAAAFGVAAGRRVPLDLAIVLTIVVTMAAAPIRRRLEQLADRLVFGRRLSGYELISQLGSRLEASPEPEDVADTVAGAVRAGLGASWVRVSLSRPHERPIAAAGIDLAAPDDPILHAPLVHGADVLGAIDCGAKTEGRYSAADRQLLATLGRQAALAIRNSQLTSELSRQFDELAASRARLVHAEAAGRRRLERDIHDGAQQELVAVLARLGLARNQLRRDKDLAEATLRECLADGRRALESLQELVRGIHPPVLTDRGLLDAVRERAARMPITTEVSSDGLRPEARFGQDIEGAAYFFVSEALSNVLKHAGATRAFVCLQSAAGLLTVEVRDDGQGFAVAAAGGSGLPGLRDRIEALGGRMDIASTAGYGTSVSASLPTGVPAHD
jgi:signal transduction histidine kinase